jgi:hypothetical protein
VDRTEAADEMKEAVPSLGGLDAQKHPEHDGHDHHAAQNNNPKEGGESNLIQAVCLVGLNQRG